MPDALSEVHWFQLQSLYNAEHDGRRSFGDLSEAGAEAMKAAGLDLEEYGRALMRLEDEGFLEVDILKDGAGKVVSAVPLRLTAQAVTYVEWRLKNEEA